VDRLFLLNFSFSDLNTILVLNTLDEAAESPNGCVLVDFLNGGIIEGQSSRSLIRAVQLYNEALKQLCEPNGGSILSLREFTAHFSSDVFGPRVVVTVEDERGVRSQDRYIGSPLRHIKTLDSHGRVRTRRRAPRLELRLPNRSAD